jgi:hypothetical protein
MTEPVLAGDPEAMRALALQIAGRADIVADTPAGFTAALDAATFEGGAGVRLRDAALTARSRAAALAAELRDLAAALYGDATSVEALNDEARAAAAAQDEAQAQAQ